MITRRRFLTIAAAALALPPAGRALPIHTWNGVALGARATIRLAHPDAPAITARVADEIERLENIFSLYRPESALSRLNATESLAAPPFELLECLSIADTAHRATEGRFDPTVQPLWQAHAQSGAVGRRPDAGLIRDLMASSGWDKVAFDSGTITLRPGMALTLNGIAQGYIADRVAAMLIGSGLGDILVDTGEFRAIGGHPDGGAWPVRLAAGGTVDLEDRSLATSAPLGTTFDRDGHIGHILDPRTGRTGLTTLRAITVTGSSAALADAVSTAACLMVTREDIEDCLSGLPDLTLASVTFA